MASKRVLGNDPFKRGAAPRVPVAAKPILTPIAPTSQPVTPELQPPSSIKGPSAAPPTVKRAIPPPPPKPVLPVRPRPVNRAPTPKAGPPLKKDAFTVPSAATRGAVATLSSSKEAGPTAHLGSPEVRSDPTPHAAAPVARELDSRPAAHASSPRLAADPVPHALAPTAEPLGGPAPHPGSPRVAADPVPHASTPSGLELQPQGGSPFANPALPEHFSLDPRSGPAPHPHSPSVPSEPVSHPNAPTAEIARPPPPPPPLPPEPLPPEPVSVTVSRAPPAPSLLSPQGASSSLKGLASALRAVLGRPSKNARLDSFGRDATLVDALQPLADALYEKYWRVTVEGAGLVPMGPSILVANHAGALPIDGPVLHHALRRERPDLEGARWLLEDQLFHAPGLGPLWNRLGAVRASTENATALLEEETPVIVFPEGFTALNKPPAERYQLQRFGRGGYVKLAARTGAPIVPVAIVGAEEAVPLLGKLPAGTFGLPFLPVTLPPLPAKWFIRFGAPVQVRASVATDPSEVQRLNAEIRDTIAAMLGELLTKRTSVF